MIRVKVCGLTRAEDALLAAGHGADLLGFIFYPPSPRSISPEACREITLALQESGAVARTVGVFVNASTEEIRATMKRCSLDYAQLSGDEPVDQLAELREIAYKAIRPQNREEAEALAAAFSNPAMQPALLVDAYDPRRYGGTGQAANPTAAAAAAQNRDLLLAGGLNPENVAEAVATIRPWGVDVASGVESAPGIKDPEKIIRFIRNAKRNPHE